MQFRTKSSFDLYKSSGLFELLRQIRQPDRYRGMNGVNVLTNAAPYEAYDRTVVLSELRAAERAGLAKADYRSSLQDGNHGLSYGLNPYTDWTLSQQDGTPDHWYLFLGLDWYSIGALMPPGQTDRWFDFIDNPFSVRDPFWENLWSWIMGRCNKNPIASGGWGPCVTAAEASDFIKADGGAFIFHNRIPYLRPANHPSADTDWPEVEWRKPSVKKDALSDLRLLREIAGGRIMVFCTNKETKAALESIGYPASSVVSWGRHPSRLFYASHFRRTNIWFQGANHFAITKSFCGKHPARVKP